MADSLNPLEQAARIYSDLTLLEWVQEYPRPDGDEPDCFITLNGLCALHALAFFAAGSVNPKDSKKLDEVAAIAAILAGALAYVGLNDLHDLYEEFHP
jgi:hypothetical protein